MKEFVKKYWIWILVAVIVIAYLITRKKKTESSWVPFRGAKPRIPLKPAGVRLGGRTSQVPTGWYNLSGMNWAGRYLLDANAFASVYTESPNSNKCPTVNRSYPNWQPAFNYTGHPASFTVNDCAFKWTNGDKAQGFYDGGGTFRVKQITSYGNIRTWNFPMINGKYPFLQGGTLTPITTTVPGQQSRE
jgi:hypothetical protein